MHRCLEIMLQHGLPEGLARTLVQGAGGDVGRLIDTIRTAIPSAKDLLKALEEPMDAVLDPRRGAAPTADAALGSRLPWLRVLLQYGIPEDLARKFLQSIAGGVNELGDKLRKFMPGDADAIIEKVRVSG